MLDVMMEKYRKLFEKGNVIPESSEMFPKQVTDGGQYQDCSLDACPSPQRITTHSSGESQGWQEKNNSAIFLFLWDKHKNEKHTLPWYLFLLSGYFQNYYY